MAGVCGRRESNRKRLVAALFLHLVLCFFISADQYIGQIILEKTSFLVNEEFKLTILIPELSPSKFSVSEPPIPDGLVLVKGPFIRAGRNGSIVDYYFIPEREGRFFIESFNVTIADKIEKTIPVFITAADIFQIRGYFDKIPPVIKWDIPDESYFPGEIIPLQFMIENIETVDLKIETAVKQKPEGYVKKISRYGEKNEEQIFSKKIMTGEIFDVSFHDHIFTAINPGETQLPDLEIFLSKGTAGYRTVLEGVPIIIDTPPGGVNGTGAVGDFTWKYEISDDVITNNKSILIKQKITGRGNFFGISMPLPFTDTPEFTELTLVKDQSDIVPEGKLYRGYRETTWLLKIIKNLANEKLNQEKLILTIPDFTWFEENYFELPPGMGVKKISGIKKEIKYLYNLPESADKLPDTPAAVNKKTYLSKVTVMIFILLLVPALFFIGFKAEKKIYIVPVIIFAVASAAFLFYKIMFSPLLYGEVQSGSGINIPVYSIPEDGGNKKAILSEKVKVRILDSKDNFYLIELPERGEEGWIEKKNIILE